MTRQMLMVGALAALFGCNKGADSGKGGAVAVECDDFTTALADCYAEAGFDGVMGLSVRTDRWRFTRWGKFNRTSGRPRFDEQFNASGVFYELYDHRGDREDDFDAFENVNLATDPAHRQTAEEMERLVEEVWDQT